MHKYLLIPILCIVTGCGEVGKNVKAEFLPRARGESDEIILVIDSVQWAGTLGLGKEIKRTFLAPMLGLPQDEPLFNVSKVSPRRLNSVLKSATNMVFVTTLDSKTADSRAIQRFFTDQALTQIKRDTSMFMIIRKDEFAKGQNVMFLFSGTEKKLAQKIKSNRYQIRGFFEESAQKIIHKKLFNKPQKELSKRLKENHGVELAIPFGWEKAKDIKNFIWYRKMDAETEQSLFIYYEPYKDQNMFNDIGTFRDKITRTFLRDIEKRSLYIQRQEIINVFTERVSFNGNFAVKARSLWKISDNSRGGPFVSYTIVDESTGMVYYVEGYVDSPGTKKKNLVRELEVILATFKTPGDLAKGKS